MAKCLLSEKEKITIVADYLQSGLSQVKYHEAHEIDVNIRTFERWCAKYKRQAVEENPEYTGASRHIVHRDDDGKYIGSEWIKYSKETDDAKKILQAFADGLKDDIPKAQPILPPDKTNDNLLALYILSDAHIGMRSDEWNLDIAETVIKGFIDNAIKQAPDAHTGVFCQLGDAHHWDSLFPLTPASGHVLDADCTSHEMIKLVVKMMRYGIDKMLRKHDRVHVIAADANHDQYSSIWLREMLDLFYAEEPRVTVDTSPYSYYAYEWGMTSLYFHHGHKRNVNQVSNVFAGMFREIFGRTKYSYGHIGHFHHTAKTENQLMQVEIHPTLAGKDDYAINSGYLSQRGAHTIIYHKHHGEVGRITIRPEMCI